VPSNRIVIEDKAQNSIENALNCLPILQSSSIQHIVLVTSDYHMPRCRLLFEMVLEGTGIDLSWTEVKLTPDGLPAGATAPFVLAVMYIAACTKSAMNECVLQKYQLLQTGRNTRHTYLSVVSGLHVMRTLQKSTVPDFTFSFRSPSKDIVPAGLF